MRGFSLLLDAEGDGAPAPSASLHSLFITKMSFPGNAASSAPGDVPQLQGLGVLSMPLEKYPTKTSNQIT